MQGSAAAVVEVRWHSLAWLSESSIVIGIARSKEARVYVLSKFEMPSWLDAVFGYDVSQAPAMISFPSGQKYIRKR